MFPLSDNYKKNKNPSLKLQQQFSEVFLLVKSQAEDGRLRLKHH